jgi:hypothetical protein
MVGHVASLGGTRKCALISSGGIVLGKQICGRL